MNDNDIIRMAKEASGHGFVGPRTIEFAERFAVLVAAEKDKEIMALVQASALVAAAEREACAKVCENIFQKTRLYPIEAEAAQDCAEAIRARSSE